MSRKMAPADDVRGIDRERAGLLPAGALRVPFADAFASEPRDLAQRPPAEEVAERRAAEPPRGVEAAVDVEQHLPVAAAADRVAPALRGLGPGVRDRDPVDLRMRASGVAQGPQSRLGERAAGVAEERDHGRPL